MSTCRFPLWFLILLTLVTNFVRADGPAVVRGRVVTTDGHPAVGARVGTGYDFRADDPKPHFSKGTTTHAEGRFTLDTAFYYGRSRGITAIDAASKTGGIVVVTEARAKEPVEIKLGPLVRVHGPVVSASAEHPLKFVSALAMLDDADHTRVADWMSFRPRKSQNGEKLDATPVPECNFLLPAGNYLLNFFEPTEPAAHVGTGSRLEVRADQPNLDRPFKNPIQLELSPVARFKNQPPPALTIKAARGVAKDVKIADFQGKWVILEFWTTTCGPCIGRGLPALMNLWDDHAASHDKFAILAIHGPGADNMADLDRQLVPIVRDSWNGWDLPFPILLDDNGQTFEAFGVEAIPMTVVINPAGKIESAGLEGLLGALPDLPVADRVAHALDREGQHYIQNGTSAGEPIGEILRTLGAVADIVISPDLAAWQAAGITPETRIPLSLLGPVTLRTYLRLLCEPFGLVAVPDAEGLLITTPRPEAIPFDLPPALATRAAERINRQLDEKLTLAVPTRPLADVLDVLSQTVGTAFILDPAARKAGKLDPSTPVTFDAQDAPLRAVLETILAPLKLAVVVHADVVLIVPGR